MSYLLYQPECTKTGIPIPSTHWLSTAQQSHNLFLLFINGNRCIPNSFTCNENQYLKKIHYTVFKTEQSINKDFQHKKSCTWRG
jgi:hypothetical protein